MDDTPPARKQRIITMSNRPPKVIWDDEWEIVAESSETTADKTWVKVRIRIAGEHADDGTPPELGVVLVYGGNTPRWSGEAGERRCGWELHPPAFGRVAGELIARVINRTALHGVSQRAIAQCISALPPEL